MPEFFFFKCPVLAVHCHKNNTKYTLINNFNCGTIITQLAPIVAILVTDSVGPVILVVPRQLFAVKATAYRTLAFGSRFRIRISSLEATTVNGAYIPGYARSVK